MNSTGENSQVDIMRITKAAAEAAEIGRWDVVARYYRERGALLSTIQTPIREASELLKFDEQICDRVRTVQSVLVSLLGEATTTRQRLQRLHRRLGVQPSTPVTVSMKV
ncbi:MAG: hypothetical protein AB7F94_07015 [Nitrospira sp.]